MKRVMITGDYHIPYMDKRAYNTMKEFAKEFKPNQFVINGDFIDFYTISKYDKNPDHFDAVEEIYEGRKILKDLRETLGSKCEIYYIEGNHDARIKKYLWKNPELIKLDVLKIESLFKLDEYNVKWIGADIDYWKNSSGCLNVADFRIMHGDNTLNGASTSKYSGYSAKNTVQTTRKNTAINHVHRVALHYNTNEDGELVGAECGCLCKQVPTANWQQGFMTFEYDKKNKSHNRTTHYIRNGILKD